MRRLLAAVGVSRALLLLRVLLLVLRVLRLLILLLALLLALLLLLAQRDNQLHPLDDILGLRPVGIDKRPRAVFRARPVVVIAVPVVVVAVKVARVVAIPHHHPPAARQARRPPQAGLLLQRREPLAVGARLERVAVREPEVVGLPRGIGRAVRAVHGRLLDQVLGGRLVGQAPVLLSGIQIVPALEDGRAVRPEGLVGCRARGPRRRRRVCCDCAPRAGLLLEDGRADCHGAGPAVVCPHDADLVAGEEFLVVAGAVGPRCLQQAECWYGCDDDCDVGLH